MSYSVAQNTSFLTIASVAQKVISFVYFTIIARLIGVENTGVYFFAIAFTAIFIVVADLGLAPVITRETARHPEDAEKYINTILWTKVIFGACAYLLMVVCANLLHYPELTRTMIYIAGVTMIFDNFHSGFYAICRARGTLIYEAAGVVGSQALTLIIGTVALYNHWPLYWLILAYTIPSFCNACFSGYWVRRAFGVKFHLRFDRAVFKMFIALAGPFFLAAIIGRLYSYSDSLLMSKMLPAKELGYWSVPYKITFAFQFIPVALAASVYPVMSALYGKEGAERIGDLFEKSLRYLFLIVFPLAGGIFALAERVIIHLYGQAYLPSVPVLRILIVGLIFGFISFITGALLNASNRQRTQTALYAAALGANVVMNLFLLRIYGITGAAVSALTGNMILSLGGLFFATRTIHVRVWRLARSAAQYFFPALIMCVAVWFFAQKINFILTVPVGAVLYFGLAWLFGGITKEMYVKALEVVKLKKPVR